MFAGRVRFVSFRFVSFRIFRFLRESRWTAVTFSRESFRNSNYIIRIIEQEAGGEGEIQIEEKLKLKLQRLRLANSGEKQE